MNTQPGRIIYDSGSVAYGSGIDSGALDFSCVGTICICVENTTNVTRTVTFQPLKTASTSATMGGNLTVSSAATATNRLAVIGDKAASTAGINLDGYTIPPPPFGRIQCASGGASGAVRIVVWVKS